VFDAIDLAAMEIRGPARKILDEQDEIHRYTGHRLTTIYVYPQQHRTLARGIRGAIRRAGKPGNVTWKGWNNEIRDAPRRFRWLYEGLPIVCVAKQEVDHHHKQLRMFA
jgi:hypothetical protein